MNVHRWDRFAWLAICLWVLSGLSGCLAQPASESVVDVVVLVPSGNEAAALHEAAVAYQNETGQVVRVETAGADVYGGKMEGLLLAGSSQYDLLYMPASQLPLWISYQAIQPVAELVSPGVLKDNEESQEKLRPWLRNLTYFDRIYGFPTQPALEAVWYRADLFQAAGLRAPTTWEAFRAAALALSQPPERYGAALAAGEFDIGFEFGALLAGFGGKVFDEPSGLPDGNFDHFPVVSLTIEQPETQQALAYYAGLFQADGLAAPESLAGDRLSAAAALQNGRAAMAILPLTAAAPLLDCQVSPKICTSPESGEPQSLLAFTRLPGLPAGVTVGELGAWVIPLHAAHAQAAREFGAWLVSPSGAQVWASASGIPAGLPDGDPTIIAKFPYLELLDGINEYRLPYPPVKTDSLVGPVLRRGVHELAAGQQDLPQVIYEMKEGLRSALYQGGYTVK